MDRNSFDALRVFLRVAELGNFSTAARSLHISTSAVSQAIRQLEERLRMRLFYRTTRSVSLTEGGAMLFARVKPAAAELSEAFSEVSSWAEQPAGLLRINLPRYGCLVLLEPLFREFVQRYPQVNLDLCIDNGLSDIVASGFDAGIRLGEALEGDVVAVPLLPHLVMALVASPEYLQRHQLPLKPLDLVEHDCICYRSEGAGAQDRWELGRNERRHEVRVKPRLYANDTLVMLQAAVAGIGIASLPRDYVGGLIAQGKLIPLLEDWWPVTQGLYVYYPNRDVMPGKLRAFLDFAKARRDSFTSPEGYEPQIESALSFLAS